MSLPTPLAAVPAESEGCRQHDCASAKLEWIDIFETGIPELDALHRSLIQDCNSLLRLVENGASWPLVVGKARTFVGSCVEHFRVEESLLEHTGFPRCAEHAAEHRRMEREMQALLARMEQFDGSLKEHRDAPRSLGPALIELILRHDLDFRSHLLHRQGR
jgi:hemerythrin-like metal-binding protein